MSGTKQKLSKWFTRNNTNYTDEDLYFKAFIKFYTIHESLGKGDYGYVYKVTNSIDKGEFALKVLEIWKTRNTNGSSSNSSMFASSESSPVNVNGEVDEADQRLAQEKAAREIRCLRELDHINILRYYFAWYIQKFPKDWTPPPNFPTKLPMYFIQTDLCYKTLEEMILEKAESDEIKNKCNEQMPKFMIQLADGVKYFHKCGIMHRDLHTKNIFFKKDAYGQDVLKIGDFGLSRFYNSQYHKTLTTDVGYWTYRCGEQDDNIPYTLKCDVFAMGVLFYQMLFPDVLLLPSEIVKNLRWVYAKSTDFQRIQTASDKMNNLIFRMLQREIIRPSSEEVFQSLIEIIAEE